MPDDLRTRIAAAVRAGIGAQFPPPKPGQLSREELVDRFIDVAQVADGVIHELPELGRAAKVTEICMASLDLDSRSGTALSDRQWLAETILNVLNGAVDE